MKAIRRLFLIGLFAAGLFILLAPETVLGYEADPLPEDNLIVNPWFRSFTDPGLPGSDGWVFVPAENGVTWGLSQKESNPSPEIIVSGTCGFKEVFCGTGARWAHESTAGDTLEYPGLDVYMYQVVSTFPEQRRLKFFMHWVNHKIDIFEVNVYGSISANGPWMPVWQVINVTQDQNPPPGQAPGRGGFPWFKTDLLDTVLGDGYPYYKVELHARYPDARTDQGDVGVKVTGIYFSTEFTDEAERLSTPVFVHNPTVMPKPGSTAVPATSVPESTTQENGSATNAPPATGIAIQTASPSDTPAAVAEVEVPTATPQVQPTERVRPTPTPIPEIAAEPEQSGNLFFIGVLAGVLLVGIFLVVRSLAARPR